MIKVTPMTVEIRDIEGTSDESVFSSFLFSKLMFVVLASK